MNDDGLKKTKHTCRMFSSCRDSCDFYAEVVIFNNTGEDIYMANADGEIITIPALPSTASDFNARLEIQYTYRSGRATKSFRPIKSYTNLNNELQTITTTIAFERLLRGATFVPQVGCSFATHKHLSDIQESNCLGKAYRDRVYAKITEEVFSGRSSPIVVYANCHDKQHKYLFLDVNDGLSSVVLDHKTELPERLSVAINQGGVYTTYDVPVDWSNLKNVSAFVGNIDDHEWIFGIDRAAVQKRITAKIEKRLASKSDEEIAAMVRAKVASLEAKLEEKTRLLEQAHREIEILKKDLATTKSELERANDFSRASYEQQILAAKLAQQQQEQENLKEKERLQKEQERINREREYAKFQYEQEINRMKVEKERANAQATKASNTSVYLKALLAVAPIITSVVSYIVGKMSAASIAGGIIGLFCLL